MKPWFLPCCRRLLRCGWLLPTLLPLAARAQPAPPTPAATEQARRLAHQQGRLADEAAANLALGRLTMGPGDLPTARARFDSAVAQARRAPQAPPALLPAALLALAQVLAEQDDYGRAEQAAREALRRYQQQGARREVARTHNGLGIIFSSRGDYPRAVVQLLAGLALARQLPDSALAANCLVNLGNVEFRRQRFGGARDYYRQALPLLGRHAPPGVRIDCLSSLAAASQQLGDYAAAGRLYQAAIAASEAVGESSQTAVIEADYAELLAARHQYPAARARYERALARLLAAHDQDNAANVQVNLADVYRRLGEPARAGQLATAALATARRLPDATVVGSASRLLAALAKARGDYR